MLISSELSTLQALQCSDLMVDDAGALLQSDADALLGQDAMVDGVQLSANVSLAQDPDHGATLILFPTAESQLFNLLSVQYNIVSNQSTFPWCHLLQLLNTRSLCDFC